MGQVLKSLVRHGITVLGGVLSSAGWGSGGDWEQIAGALSIAISVGWSIIEARNRARQ